MVLQELTREQRLSLVPEEAYRIFFTEAPEAALVLENETIVDCNDRALDLFGYEVKTEIVGKSTADLSPAQQPDGADSRRKMQDVIHAALQGARQTGEWEHVRKDGARLPVEVTLCPVRAAAPGMLLVTVHDVSARVRLEQDLRERRRQLLTLMDNLPGMAYRSRNDADWTMEFVSDGCTRLTGYTPADLIGNHTVSYASLIHPDDRDAVWANVQNALRKHVPFQLMYRLTARDSRVKWVQEHGRGVLGRDGSVVALEGIVTDITEQKESSDALRRSEERYRQVVDTADEGICIIDRDFVINFVNPRMTDLLQYSAGEMIGRPLIDFIGPGEADGYRRQMEARRAGKKGHYERVFIRKDGSICWMLVSATPLHDARGTFAGSFAMFTDITDRKQAALALAESEARFRTFFANSPAGLGIIDRDRRYVTVNDMLAAYNRSSKESHVGKHIREIVPEMAAHAETALTEVFKTGRAIVNREIASGPGYGEKQWWMASFFPIKTGREQPSTVGLIVVNITERKMMENRLRETRLFNERIVKATPEIIYILDLDTRRFTQLNMEIAGKTLGYPPQDLEKMSDKIIPMLLYPDDFALVERHFEEMRSAPDGKVVEFEIRLKNGTGQWRWFRMRETVFTRTPDGIVRQLIGSATDVTGQKQDRERIQANLEALRRMTDGIIAAISHLVEMRDPYTAGHQRRVAQLSYAMARELGLPERQAQGIRVAGLIHDVGKMFVPAEILSKPGKLSPIEFEIIKVHPRAGYEVLRSIDFPWPVAEIAYQHQERLNGSGYPRKLTGDRILPETKIVSVADTIEAMTFRRPYRNVIGLDRAMAQIEQHKGSLYDAHAVDACLRLFRENRFTFEP